jgi:glycosyltransferase involved in cell wall biosynthesis
MRIGLMLRAIDEKGGIGVYTRNLTEELLERDRENQYVLFYREPSNLGRFAHYSHATELLVKASNKALWDQWAIPRACRRAQVDVLFHPKFTVPLLAPCKTVMVLHGAGWFLPEHQHYWPAVDRLYIRLAMPLYCRRASAIISVSEITTEVFKERFNLPAGKIKTVYFAPSRHFRRIVSEEELNRVRAKYGLPERFILTLSKYGGGQRKNIEGILAAFARHHGRTDHHLVIGGKDCERFRDDYQIPASGHGEAIVFPGWIDQEDLPAVYSLADLFLYPSNLEAFPIPITEALACGTPLVSSDNNGLREIAGDAALLVDAEDPDAIARAIQRVLTDPALRENLAAKAAARSASYSWSRCAEQTLDMIQGLVA